MNPSAADPIYPQRLGDASLPDRTPPTPDRALRAADPTAFLIAPRILRRVIKEDRRLTGLALRVPHNKSYLIAREPLLEIVEKMELGVPEDELLPEHIILLARPDARKLEALGPGEELVRCWRLLFHARIHQVLEGALAGGKLTPTMVRGRIHQIGTAEFDEVRNVLAHEGFLLPPRTDEAVYVEFAAVYLELKYFAPTFLPRFFPSIGSWATVDQILGQDFDAAALFGATRPHGAPAPKDSCPLSRLDPWHAESAETTAAGGTASAAGAAEKADEASAAGGMHPADNSLGAHDLAAPDGEAAVRSPRSERDYYRLMYRAQQATAVGNNVRSAILHAKALTCAPAALADRARAALTVDVRRLTGRIQAALAIGEEQAASWQEAIAALVEQSRSGWTAEARLLYDLQKVCVDCERELYTVDVVEWVCSFFRRPLQRPLPHQREVLVSKHLRSAARRLPTVRLSDGQRRALGGVIHAAVERAEHELRGRFRPLVAGVLDEVKLLPQNLPEEVARDKLVEELLDRIVEHGHLGRGDLRDALSRNHLKLPDLSDPVDLLRGDQLLRADRRLGVVLDGVYRPAEFYLRWMQQLSSLAFGTPTGRLFTRFVAVPFGGAYLTLAFLHHLAEMVLRTDIELNTPESLVVLGTVLMGLINFDEFRHSAARLTKTWFRGMRRVVVDPVLAVIGSDVVQWILQSRAFALARRFLFKPALVATAVWLFVPAAPNGRSPGTNLLLLFLATNLLLNSRVGRSLDEMVTDWLVQTWRRYGLRMLSGLFFLIMDLFKRLLEAIDRSLYAVDEWLRFRSGDSRVSFFTKAVLGVGWFAVTYIVRFCVTLLIEPQVNPIKHFPVVTVSHKILLPLTKPFGDALAVTMEKQLAYTLAGTIIISIPGVFGFLVWELKENWRLYAANRPDGLGPEMIGRHGETMASLLKPGFHSGTIPKRFAKLRRAERKARDGGSWQAARKHLHVLQDVQLSIRRHLERDLLTLVPRSRRWQGPPLRLDEIRLGTNCVRIALACDLLPDAPLRIALEVESGWLAAWVIALGWAAQLTPAQHQTLETVLEGFYKSAGVDVVRQQLETALPGATAYELTPGGILAWFGGDYSAAAMYPIGDNPLAVPQPVNGGPRCNLAPIERWRLLYRDVPVRWHRWVTAWEHEQAGRPYAADWLVPVRVLRE